MEQNQKFRWVILILLASCATTRAENNLIPVQVGSNKMKPSSMTAVLLISLIGLASCAGARGYVRFDHLRYPVSMSPALYDADGKNVMYERQLKPVDRVEYTKTIWSMFWTLVVFNADQDLSAVVNEKIDQNGGANGGAGLVNLSVGSRGCVLNYIPIANLLPIWPGCTVVKIEGDVVKIDVKK